MDNKAIFSKKSFVDQVYETVKQRILVGEYKPGFRLKDKMLAREFGISSIPVREALKLLWSEGFINIVPYKGAEVIDFNDEKIIRNTCDLRAMIESYAIEKCIENFDPEIIRDLKKHLSTLKKLSKKKDYERTIKDLDFHRKIVEGCKNELILKIYDNIQFQPRPNIRTYDKKSNSENHLIEYKRHEKLFNLIAAKDLAGAKEEIKKHIYSSYVK